MARSLPNIIVTGTPGTGKTTHCEVLAEKTGLKHLSVNQVVKERECHEGWDDEYQSWIVDEDKVGAPRRASRARARTAAGWLTGFTVASGRHRRGVQGRRVHNRLARVRPVPQELDRPGCRVEGGLGGALRPAEGEVSLGDVRLVQNLRGFPPSRELNESSRAVRWPTRSEVQHPH